MTFGVDLGGLAGQAQRVAHEIRDVLHFGPLVVVGDDHGVPLAGQVADLRLQCRDLGRGLALVFDDGKRGHQAGSVVRVRGG